MIVETRKQITFNVESLHQMLQLPDDAVIRDVMFTDPNRGLMTCYYVTHEEQDHTPPGMESLAPRRKSHLISR